MADTPGRSIGLGLGLGLGLVLDCADPERQAEFWAAALGYVNVDQAGAYVMLLPNGQPGPKLIEAPDVGAEAARRVRAWWR